MKNRMIRATFGMVLLSAVAFAQAPQPAPRNVPAPNATAPAANQAQMLADMLRSAATFHAMVQSLNLQAALGPDRHVIGPDGREHHSMERTAETIGAGAGAGAAVGAMTHSQNGVMIGALVGAGAAIVIDQILRDREEQRLRASAAVPSPQAAPNNAPNINTPNYDGPQAPPRQFRTRDADSGLRTY
jgi:hypothetical protein